MKERVGCFFRKVEKRGESKLLCFVLFADSVRKRRRGEFELIFFLEEEPSVLFLFKKKRLSRGKGRKKFPFVLGDPKVPVCPSSCKFTLSS